MTTKTYKGCIVDYCPQCERDTLFCPICGMNECSAGYGTLPDGSTCKFCPVVHEIADAYYKDDPEFYYDNKED